MYRDPSAMTRTSVSLAMFIMTFLPSSAACFAWTKFKFLLSASSWMQGVMSDRLIEWLHIACSSLVTLPGLCRHLHNFLSKICEELSFIVSLLSRRKLRHFYGTLPLPRLPMTLRPVYIKDDACSLVFGGL